MAQVTITGGNMFDMRHVGVGQGGSFENKGRVTGFNSQPRRYELHWVAGARGRPSVNADILSTTEADRMVADPMFELVGLNAVKNDIAHGVEGGLLLSTRGADGDATVIAPHLDTKQSAWKEVTWGTDRETEWECWIAFGANITNLIVWAGLKLTNVHGVAADDDQAYFRMEDDVNSGAWQIISSIGGTDTTTNSGVPAVAALEEFHLKITFDAARLARFYINSALIFTSEAIDAADLIPYIGVEADGATSVETLTVYGQSISRLVGA